MPSQTWTTSCSRTSLVRPAATGPSKTDVSPCSEGITLMSLLSSLRFWESALKQSKHEATQFFKDVNPGQSKVSPTDTSMFPSWSCGPTTEVVDRKQSQHTCTRTKKQCKKSFTVALIALVFIPIKFQVFFHSFTVGMRQVSLWLHGMMLMVFS